MFRLFLFALIVPTLSFAKQVAIFTPPKGWEMTDPRAHINQVEIGFVDKSKSGFCPSLTLTKETIQVTPQEYLAIVQKNSEQKRRKWKRLGVFPTQSGPGELIEIEVPTKFGQARLLQLIQFSDGQAFILTAGALQKGFHKHSTSFEGAFRSFRVADDLVSLVEDPFLKQRLSDAWKKKGEGIESGFLSDLVLEECSHMGPVWQLMMLK